MSASQASIPPTFGLHSPFQSAFIHPFNPLQSAFIHPSHTPPIPLDAGSRADALPLPLGPMPTSPGAVLVTAPSTRAHLSGRRAYSRRDPRCESLTLRFTRAERRRSEEEARAAGLTVTELLCARCLGGEMMTEKPANLSAPTPRTAQAIAEAKARVGQRPPRVRVKAEVRNGPAGAVMSMSAPHSDGVGHYDQIRDVLGTSAHAFSEQALTAFAAIAGDDERSINACLALVGAIEPRDELEAALAVQIAANHAFSLSLLSMARNGPKLPVQEAYVTMATKISRTMLSTVEALGKLRGGGKQVVEHRYINVQGNAVVGNVNTGGGGDAVGNRHQSHTPALESHPSAALAPVWGQDAGREPVSVAGGAHSLPMSDARRDEPGSTNR